jgi:hypothetical protein
MYPTALMESVLASSLTTEVAQPLWAPVRELLIEKGVEDVPGEVATSEQLQEAETALSREADRFTDNEVHQLTIEALAAAQDTANGIRTERMRQARLIFNAALGLTVLGVLIIWMLLLTQPYCVVERF